VIKKKVFIVVVSALSAVVIIQSLIIIRPFGRREVTTSEAAILIARAELVRKYGEEEIDGMEFDAFIDASNRRYWQIGALPGSFGYPPRVYVRVSDGKAVEIWRDGVRNRLDMFIDSWFRR